MIVNYPLFFLRLLAYFLALYLSLLVLMRGWPLWVLLWGPLVVVLLKVLVAGREAKYKALYNAHWASKEELAPLKQKYPNRNGLMLGFAYGDVIGIQPGSFGQREMGHLLVCGPSRSGKGLHLTSNLLSWGNSVVVVDIKGELYRLTAGHRARMGQKIITLNPTGEGHRYDPFSELVTDEAIRSVVTMVLDPDADGSNAAFARRATFALFAAVKGAIILKQPVLPFVRRMTALGLEKFCKELWRIDDDSVKTALVDFLREDPLTFDWAAVANNKFLDNTWIGMLTKLQPLFSEGILKMTSANDFTSIDLVREPTTVYLVFRESELEYTGTAFRMVLLAMINTLIRHFDLNPDEKTIPLQFAFDEAGRLSIPRLPDVVSTVAGRGMSAVIYVQSISQLESAYGEDGKVTILDNTHTKIFYRPKDSDTADYVSEKCGQLMAEDLRQSDGQEGKVQQSVGVRPRELVTGDELQHWSAERAVVITELAPVAAYRMTPWLLPGGRMALTVPPPRLPQYDFDPRDVALPSDLITALPSAGIAPPKVPPPSAGTPLPPGTGASPAHAPTPPPAVTPSRSTPPEQDGDEPLALE